METMGNSSEGEASHSDIDPGLGGVDALFVVTDEAAPSGEPAEGALHDPAARHDLKARLVVEVADDLDDESLVRTASGPRHIFASQIAYDRVGGSDRLAGMRRPVGKPGSAW